MSAGFQVSSFRGEGGSLFVWIGRVVGTSHTRKHKSVIFAAEYSVSGCWATKSSGWCQLWSYWLSAPNLPFHTLLGDAGTGTPWRSFLLCQLVRCGEAARGGGNMLFPVLLAHSGQCLSNGLSCQISSSPHTSRIGIITFFPETPLGSARSLEVWIIASGGEHLQQPILITQSLPLPPSVEVVTASCNYFLIPQCLRFAFSVLQYLFNQFFDVKFFVFWLDWLVQAETRRQNSCCQGS